MPLDAKNDISARIEDAVFELMGTTPVQAIRVTDVLRLAHLEIDVLPLLSFC